MRDDVSFLDTSGWMALLNTGDRMHAQAAVARRDVVRRRKQVVLTDWIIAETGNGLARTPHRGLFIESARLLFASPECRIVHLTDELLARAIDPYHARPDKKWGLVDCASFVVMTEGGIGEAITSDRHSEQAGFRRLITGPGDREGA